MLAKITFIKEEIMARQARIAELETLRMVEMGKHISLSYAGRRYQLKKSRGLKIWAELIRNPGIPISYAQLDSAMWNDPQAVGGDLPLAELKELDFRIQGDFPSLELVDLRTIKEVKGRLNQIIAELAELEHYHDYARQDDLLQEKEELVEYLKQVYRPQGRLVRIPSESLKCERRVMKALTRALAEIHKVEPELAQLLKESLHRGSALIYQPG